MKRTTGRIIFAMLLAILVAASGALGWLFATPEGTRWLLDAVSRHSGVKIDARKVEGRLYDHLRLADVRMETAQQKLYIDSLELRWRPILLLAGEVAVKELVLRDVRIHDMTPVSGRPPELAWPRVSGIPTLLGARVERLRIDGLTYRRLEGEPFVVTTLSASLTWRDLLLSLDRLNLDSPAGSGAGSVAAGFAPPSLRLDLAVTTTSPVAGMERFTLKAGLAAGRAPEQLAGLATFSAGTGSVVRVELAGEVGMTRSSFNLRQLRLTAPGRRGTASGDGRVILAAREPQIELRIKAAGIDLAPEAGHHTSISGEMTLEGSAAHYRGRFDLADSRGGWRAGRITGVFTGDAAGMRLAPLKGRFLDGTVEGSLEVGWRDGRTVSGSLRGRNLNPARFSPDWRGVVNLDLDGSISWSETALLRWSVSGKLIESRLHDRALTGELSAGFADGSLRIDTLALHGNGFDISAAGEPDERLPFSVRVSDLSRVLPGSEGKIQGTGWVRWHGGALSGDISASGRDLAAYGMRVASAEIAARLGEEKARRLLLSAELRKVEYDGFRAGSIALEGSGSVDRHTLSATMRSAGAELRLALAGAYRRGSWEGEIAGFSGRDSVGAWRLDAPARLTLAPAAISLSTLVVTGERGERLEIAGDLGRHPLHGALHAEWQGVNLARLNQWMKGVAVSGSSEGRFAGTLAEGERLGLTVSAAAEGTVTAAGERITVRRSTLNIDGSDRGLLARFELYLQGGGELNGTLSSAMPARLAVPEGGSFALEWKGMDTVLLTSLVPGDVRVEGAIVGRLSGRLLPGSRLEMEGRSSLLKGKLRWLRPAGEIGADLRSASVSWEWRGEALDGELALSLAEQGKARGSFRLPLPARLPVAMEPGGEVRGTLTGQFEEMGLLTALFPEIVRESHGAVDALLRVGGSWEAPQLDGNLRLSKAGGYFPTAGIRLADVELTAFLDKDVVRIESFRASSGPGRIEGSAVIQLAGGGVTGYRGEIRGERFRAIYLPELQLLANPRLDFEGSAQRLVVRGELGIPELMVYGEPGRAAVAPSRDVIIVGAPHPPEKAPPIDLDIQVRLVLGDQVLVKAEGLDARLGGSMELTVRGLDRVTSRGEINVVKGRYKTYGVNLEIVRGRVFYAGGPVGEPTLDILALRTVGEVRAGVTVGGTPRAPVIKLYSEPPMPDVDVLAYVVLGHPLGEDREQGNLMAQAAGVLLSTGQSVVLQEQIKGRLGLSTLEIGTGAGGAGRMGYKPMQAIPPGMAVSRPAAAGISGAMLTVGKYLTPKLYASYGRSLFAGGNLFRLRYDISRRLEVETETGTESGADIYYKIDFR